MYQPKISFVTATYNSAKTLKQLISSIANQTYQNIEHVIIDGASTDGTLEIIKKYQKEGYCIRWISEKDDGPCDAVAKGTRMASGDYINILGSDDCLLSPTILEKVIRELQSKPDVLLCSQYIVDEKTQKQYLLKGYIDRNSGLPSYPTEGTYVGKNVLKKYPYDQTYLMAADRKLNFQFVLDKTLHLKVCDMPVAFFSLNGMSSHNGDLSEMRRVYKELHINAQVKDPSFYNVKRRITSAMPALYNIYLRIFKPWKYYDWQPHTCENKICRWCGRP